MNFEVHPMPMAFSATRFSASNDDVPRRTINLIHDSDNADEAHCVMQCHLIVCCLSLTFSHRPGHVSRHGNQNSSTYQILHEICFGSSTYSASVWLPLMGLMVVVVPSTLRLSGNTCCPDNLSFQTITSMTALRLCRIAKRSTPGHQS